MNNRICDAPENVFLLLSILVEPHCSAAKHLYPLKSMPRNVALCSLAGRPDKSSSTFYVLVSPGGGPTATALAIMYTIFLD